MPHIDQTEHITGTTHQVLQGIARLKTRIAREARIVTVLASQDPCSPSLIEVHTHEQARLNKELMARMSVRPGSEDMAPQDRPLEYSPVIPAPCEGIAAIERTLHKVQEMIKDLEALREHQDRFGICSSETHGQIMAFTKVLDWLETAADC